MFWPLSSDWDLERIEARSTFNKHFAKCGECAIWNSSSGEETQECSYTCNDNENIFFALISSFFTLFLSIFNLDILKHWLYSTLTTCFLMSIQSFFT